MTIFRTCSVAFVIAFAITLAGCSSSSFPEPTPEEAYQRCLQDAMVSLFSRHYRQDGSGVYVKWKYRICVGTNQCTHVDDYTLIPGGVRAGNHTILGTMDIVELIPDTENIYDYCEKPTQHCTGNYCFLKKEDQSNSAKQYWETMDRAGVYPDPFLVCPTWEKYEWSQQSGSGGTCLYPPRP